MNILLAIPLLILGLAILWKSAEALVSGAVSLAKQLGISPLVIGLTVVAMGTSAPEVAASIAAAIRGTGDIALGNVYGSNIANLALVGGLCAMIRPITVKLKTLKREIPAMLVVALLLWPVLRNLTLSRSEGLCLLILFTALISFIVYSAHKEAKTITPDTRYEIFHRTPNGGDTKKSVLFVVIGLAGLALGADLAVRAAVVIGQRIGLSNAVIGLTIIAVGTSLPELVTCVVAALKGQDDISIGNLVGSNIFNTLLVTGTAGTIKTFSIAPRLAGPDYVIMLIVSTLFIVMAFIGKVVSRIDGAILLLVYIAYIVYLFGFTASV